MYFLRYTDSATAYAGYYSKTDAVQAFSETARELWALGQKASATLHVAEREYLISARPDYLLNVSSTGRVNVVAA